MPALRFRLDRPGPRRRRSTRWLRTADAVVFLGLRRPPATWTSCSGSDCHNSCVACPVVPAARSARRAVRGARSRAPCPARCLAALRRAPARPGPSPRRISSPSARGSAKTDRGGDRPPVPVCGAGPASRSWSATANPAALRDGGHRRAALSLALMVQPLGAGAGSTTAFENQIEELVSPWRLRAARVYLNEMDPDRRRRWRATGARNVRENSVNCGAHVDAAAVLMPTPQRLGIRAGQPSAYEQFVNAIVGRYLLPHPRSAVADRAASRADSC